jgi:ComF family protein
VITPAPLADVLRFLLPARCLGCASPLALDAAQALVCDLCLAALREPPWPRCSRCQFPRGTGRAPAAGCLECAGWPDALAGALTSAVLEEPAEALVHALKYGGWRGLAEPMGRRMARVCPLPEHVIVAVPTSAARVRRRGYNQAALLADAYARALGASRVDGLVRLREGPSQVSLPPDQRKSNVDGAFQAAPEAIPALRGRSVALVDDVLTTGSTAAAAACALERAGARGVIVVSFARALPGRTLD